MQKHSVIFMKVKIGMVGKNKMKSWKACVRTWEKSSRNNNTNDRTTSHKFNGDMNYGDGSF